MKFFRRQFLHLAAGAAVLPALSRIARAQTYPSRPITMIVPFAAGGGTDVVGRMVAERIRASLGQPVIIENVGGANGSIGVGRVARSAPDGYTLCVGVWNTHVSNGASYPLQYNVTSDFEPIGLVSIYPGLIVARNTLLANGLVGLINWLKANPDKASMGIPGAGAASHIYGLLFQKETGTRFQFVPYRGNALALQDLVAGEIDLMFDAPAGCLPLVRAGQIKAYAVMSKSRFVAAPEIPTVDEAGLPGFYASNWNALFAPKGTPKNVVDKVNAAIREAMGNANIRQRLTDLGQEIPLPEQQTPQALRVLQKAEIEKWWPIIKAANIRAE
jgi:tripartite-type tricarboxylate transporter receptor subunit TctC